MSSEVELDRLMAMMERSLALEKAIVQAVRESGEKGTDRVIQRTLTCLLDVPGTFSIADVVGGMAVLLAADRVAYAGGMWWP